MIQGTSDERPLDGSRVVVTRAAHQAAGLCGAFRKVGARPALLPLLEVRPADPTDLARIGSLERFHWLVFTSANAVEAFLPALLNRPRELHLAAVGEATAQALEQRGFAADLIPEEHRGEGLVAALAPLLKERARVLLPQAEDAHPLLAEGLRSAGAEVETFVAYRKALPAKAAETARLLFTDAALGWVTFTSPRIVRSFVSLFGDSWEQRRQSLLAASIGPVTSRALVSSGVSPAAEAAQPSDAALVAAVVATTPESLG